MSNPLYVNLGVDWGTSFTKVCARAEGVDVQLLDWSGEGLEGALVSSVVLLDDEGLLSVPEPGLDNEWQNRPIRYLKMAIAEDVHLVDGLLIGELGATASIALRALSAFYLATIFERSREWLVANWSVHIGDQCIELSANVGLPVEHIDAECVSKFEELFTVAWKWFGAGGPPSHQLNALIDEYRNAAAELGDEPSDCWHYPEIAAAVMSFAMDSKSPDDVYVYFDIGGGTLDGVTFRKARESGLASIDFYSGRVAPLGLDSVIEEAAKEFGEDQLSGKESELKAMVLDEATVEPEAFFRPKAEAIAKFVGRVVYEGKTKDLNSWREGRLAETGRPGLNWRRPDHDLNPLTVFVGGGACKSRFYQTSIKFGYDASTLRNYDIPPFKLKFVPAPPDLDMGTVPRSEYHRFLIAYGLSVPAGEGPELKLPGQFDTISRRIAEAKNSHGDYADHKDMYD